MILIYYVIIRLNQDKSGGAWCPSKQVSESNSGKEWLQVNLTSGLYVITGVSTQGRFGNGMGVEYVEQYWIEYSRNNGKTWTKWISHDGSHVCFYIMLFYFVCITFCFILFLKPLNHYDPFLLSQFHYPILQFVLIWLIWLQTFSLLKWCIHVHCIQHDHDQKFRIELKNIWTSVVFSIFATL